MKQSTFRSTAVLLALFPFAAAAQDADLILTNGEFYTVEEKAPMAEAVAIRDGRFLAVGSFEEVSVHQGDDTDIVDLEGRFVMPGLIDAHIHPIRSQLIANVDISVNAAVPMTPDEFAAEIKAYADANPDKPWLIGAAFSWGTFTDTPLNFAYIDAIVPDRPVVIEDETGHIAIANSKALELAGVTEDTPDPVGGYFGRDADGKLNGLLYETAMQQVFGASPNYTLEQVTTAAEEIFPLLHAMGVTGVKVAQGDHLWAQAVQILDRQGRLNMQVSMTPYEVDFYRQYSNAELLRNRQQYETDHFRIDGVKLFADGVPFGQTMLIKRPYPGTDNFGLPATPPEQLREKIVHYNGLGLGVMVHSTGDRGAEIVMEGVEMAMAAHGVEEVRALRNHIAHNVIVDFDDIDRMKYTNVIMEFSPSFWFPRAIIDAAEADLGAEMLQEVWPLGPVLRSGVNVAIGSDWNQAQADPFINIETLVTRQAPGAGAIDPILGPSSAVALEDALYAYTMGGAYAMFLEEEIGSIRAGKRANFIVLDQDLTEINPSQIHATIVLETWFEGNKVYEGTDKVSF
ncbi:N-substituted formamide deformylase precursor [Ruegeria sp. THAF57]|uniref:amidohydrolase n=1 Tax=Ruegeria sp. THAF57 TaxID=2744555 RepID=UPI0015DFD9B8|nr:amidohydrolase [Ruegeria sp. THAF57]CAD0185304.1 N-substituted formamide deformylase precursor [Ruegeria sp. THAF57]